MARESPVGHGLLIVQASRSHSVRHTTLSRTPLDEWSARRRDIPYNAQHRVQSVHPPTPHDVCQ